MGLRFFYCGGLGGTELKKLLRVLFPAVEGLECGLKYLSKPLVGTVVTSLALGNDIYLEY